MTHEYESVRCNGNVRPTASSSIFSLLELDFAILAIAAHQKENIFPLDANSAKNFWAFPGQNITGQGTSRTNVGVIVSVDADDDDDFWGSKHVALHCAFRKLLIHIIQIICKNKCHTSLSSLHEVGAPIWSRLFATKFILLERSFCRKPPHPYDLVHFQVYCVLDGPFCKRLVHLDNLQNWHKRAMVRVMTTTMMMMMMIMTKGHQQNKC